MHFIGIDPGQTGGICVLSDDGDVVWLDPFADMWTMAAHLKSYTPGSFLRAHVYLEKAQAMPKNGAVSMFNYGDHFGQLQGLLIALHIPYTLVPPAMWTREMLTGTKAEGKDRNVAAARRLMPQASFIARGSRAKKPHLGMVDAYLIAEWGRRQMTRAAAP